MMPGYAALHCLSNFSFLRGASHSEELVARAKELGYSAIALTDECSVAGVVRAHVAAREAGIKLLIGAEFALTDGPRLVLLAPDRAAYGDLSEIITIARRKAKKGAYRLTRDDLPAHAGRCLALWLPDDAFSSPQPRSRTSPPSPLALSREANVASSLIPIPSPGGRRGRAAARSRAHLFDWEREGRSADAGRYDSERGNTLDQTGGDLEFLQEIFTNRLWIAVESLLNGEDRERLERLQALSARFGVPLVAAGGVQMHGRSRKRLHDVLTAIRLGTTVAEAGFALAPNGERCLRSRATLARLYPPELLAETLRVAERCTFSLDELRYEYPDEIVPAGETPASYLRRLTEEGMHRRWPVGTPQKVRTLVERELKLIAELRYEPYFLTVYDAVSYARSRNIYCQGRGSAANSAVCFCLGITEVDPDRIQTLFERFISKERNEPPDIDVDFEHERREEVIQYIYAKYGRNRAALAATVITYRTRSAVRDVGKALGFSLEQVDRLAKNFQWWDGFPSPSFPSDRSRLPVSRDLSASCTSPEGEGSEPKRESYEIASANQNSLSHRERVGVRGRAHSVWSERLREAGFDPENPRLKQLVVLVGTLRGFPRHLSQHVGGFVIARDSLARLVPIENAAMPERTVIQWDKDDIDALGLLKVDCLGLGMLTVLHKAFDLIERHRGHKLTPAEVPAEDPKVYEMIGHADTVGVFQIESRAQMSMLPRLKPKCFYDLVIEIAIVRPGPIQGNMVHPYLRRRQGLEPVSYPSDAVKAALERTLGVPIFQEQVIKLAMVAAGFSGGEADGLRRAMAAWKRRGGLEPYERRLIDGMRANGYAETFARQIFEQIKGFGEYGFPESHSASFALIAYVSAWLKHYEPAIFLAAILNSQPMGFYQPSQLVQDARRHGVDVRPVDVCASDWDCTIETSFGEGLINSLSPRERVRVREDSGHEVRCLPHPFPSDRSRLRSFADLSASLHVTGGRGGKAVLAVRLGLRHVKGLSRTGAERLVTARSNTPFENVDDMVRRAALDRRDRAALASGGALKSLAGHRYRARWAVAGIEPERPLLAGASISEAIPLLRAPTEADDIVADYAHVGLTLGRHPLTLLRRRLAAHRSLSAREIGALPHGQFARTTGIVVCRQHPSSANGVIFLTLEDETGNTNIIVWSSLVDRYRRALVQASLLTVDGEVQREGEVLHIVAQRLEDCSFLLGQLETKSRDFQ